MTSLLLCDPASLARDVRDRGGVARVATLQREGWSRYRIRAAIENGALRRIRRDWVATPDADVELVAAARAGVVLSCVTAARRLGAWVLREERPHVAASAHASSRGTDRARIHWAEPVVPRHPDALCDPIENVLAVVAFCRPHDEALAVWESALHLGLTSKEAMRTLPLSGTARCLLEEASPLPESGLETIFFTRLRWLRVRIVPQAWIAGHRVDFLLGDRLVVQIDGGHHVGAQRTRDIAHDAELALRGYTVLRFTYAQIVDDWPGVQDRIAAAIARGLHLAR